MQTQGALFVYVGTYSPKEKEGIHVFAMDMDSGALQPVDSISGCENPSYLTIHPQSDLLYAVNEVAETDGARSGAVSAFSIDRATGKLTFLNKQLSGGALPCHVSVDSSGECLLVANYSGGNVGLLPIHKTGELGAPATIQHQGSSIDPSRQGSPHAHSITPDPTNRYALAADLGLDQILVYRIDLADKCLVPHSIPYIPVQPGSGPRHLDFHPNGKYLYVINEIGNTVMAFAYDADKGQFEHIQTLASLPEEFQGSSSTADIHVLPGGNFLYGSNRGHDSLAIYAIDAATGKCSFVGHQSTEGQTPRNFGIDPSGSFVLAANQDSDSIVCFRVDARSGQLTPAGQITEVPKPVCVKFLRSG